MEDFSLFESEKTEPEEVKVSVKKRKRKTIVSGYYNYYYYLLSIKI